MSTIKGIHVPTSDDLPLEVVEFDRGDIAAIQRYVGGWFECVDVERPGATIFCDEEAKVKGLPLNRRATLLWWVGWSGARHVDVIMGDCLILGLPDLDGDTQSVPDELVDLLFHTTKFRYEVLVTGESKWHHNQLVFDNVFRAYNEGLLLADRWGAVEEVRVVPVDQDAA